MGVIRVNNKTNDTVEASISNWDGGSSDWFTLPEKWNRNDERGFVLAVKSNSQRKSFLIETDRDFDVSKDDQGNLKVTPA